MEQNKNYLIFVVVASSFAVLLLIVVIINVLILYRSKRKSADAEIELGKQKVNDLISKHEVESVSNRLEGQFKERKRISLELHDNVGSMVFANLLRYRNFVRDMPNLKKLQKVASEQITDLMTETIDEIRRISHDLYDNSITNFGYKNALEQLINTIEESNSLKIEFEDQDIQWEKYHDIEKELYRITQELLSNTLKHSKANHVVINISSPHDTFEFEYQDNGIGFNLQSIKNSDGIGFENMKERVRKINGVIAFQSKLGSGMTCTININDGK